MFKYQNYFIATDANHVTQHRRIVTPWFYFRLKSIHYVRVNDIPYFIMGLVYRYSGWTSNQNQSLDSETKKKLETVTQPFSYQDRIAK